MQTVAAGQLTAPSSLHLGQPKQRARDPSQRSITQGALMVKKRMQNSASSLQCTMAMAEVKACGLAGMVDISKPLVQRDSGKGRKGDVHPSTL